jgi:hypothetical protein
MRVLDLPGRSSPLIRFPASPRPLGAGETVEVKPLNALSCGSWTVSAHPVHSFFQKILPRAPLLFMAQGAPGNGHRDVSVPPLPWHLVPKDSGYAPFVVFGFVSKVMRVLLLLHPPCCKFSAKMSFLLLKVRSNSDMHSAICKGCSSVGSSEVQKGLKSEVQKNAQRHLVRSNS